ncbi:hypothetical protein BD309DRAFT_954702, partial [Dichomitus squalens]
MFEVPERFRKCVFFLSSSLVFLHVLCMMGFHFLYSAFHTVWEVSQGALVDLLVPSYPIYHPVRCVAALFTHGCGTGDLLLTFDSQPNDLCPLAAGNDYGCVPAHSFVGCDGVICPVITVGLVAIGSSVCHLIRATCKTSSIISPKRLQL